MKYILPKKCRCLCCKESTKDRLFINGYKKLKDEIQISTIFKNLRVVKSAVKRGFTEAEWRSFKENHGFRKLHIAEHTKKKVFM